MEIKKRVVKALKSSEAKAAEEVIEAGVSVKHPIAGVFLSIVHEIAGLADEVRVDAVVEGLSTGLDQERQINQLYNYVNESEENAFYVSNTLRKALLSDSPIACTIMGRILACHVNECSKYSQDDNVIFHALENATDQDIKMFVKIMKEYKTKNDDGNDVFRIPNEIMMHTDIDSTLNWCVFNRIFNGSSGILWGIDGQDYDDSHSPTSAANKLFEYIDSVKQVLSYDKYRTR